MGKSVQTVVEVGAEPAFAHHAKQVLVGCGNNAHVHLLGARTPQPLELPFLKDPRQLRLEFERQITNFVKEQRAAVGCLKATDGLHHGPGKCAPFVPEPFAFQQGRRNRCAVQSDKSVVATRA